MSSNLRVGIVDYLNSRPLAWDFLRGRAPDGFEAFYLPPAGVADGLRDGQLDVGLVPSIEVQRIAGLKVLAGSCVAAQEEVRSVLLVCKVPPQEIRRIALDKNSRTSAALVKILLLERYGVEPESTTSSPRIGQMLAGADAALIIGDPALSVSRGEYQILDLAREWRTLTGLPFVFAVWAVRGDGAAVRDYGQIREVFASSRENGLAELGTIAEEAARELALDRSVLETYLRKNLSFELGEAERRSLEQFYCLAQRYGLIEEVREIEFLA
jgi:chorismate dehydratase